MPLKKYLSLFTLALALMATGATAQISITSEDEEEEREKVSDLTWADENDLVRKERDIEYLGQRHFGQSLRHDKSDLVLLQRIADRELIDQDDVEKLQALGVVLGNTLARELELEWKVYTDEEGRSRALCVPDTEYCLFPMTMLSRRLEVGLSVDVEKIYNDAVETISPYTPDRSTYGEKKPDPRERPSWLKDRESKPPIRIRVE